MDDEQSKTWITAELKNTLTGRMVKLFEHRAVLLLSINENGQL